LVRIRLAGSHLIKAVEINVFSLQIGLPLGQRMEFEVDPSTPTKQIKGLAGNG